MLLATLKDLAFVCSTIVGSLNAETSAEYNVYNEQSKLIKIQQTSWKQKTDMILGCMEIGAKSIEKGLDPEIAIAIGWHESKFHRNIVSDTSGGKTPSIGMMQIIPKTWCRIEQNVETWKSKSQYFQDRTCDLENAGILAILSLKTQPNMKKGRVRILKDLVSRVLESNSFEDSLKEYLSKNKHIEKWNTYTNTQKNNVLLHYYSNKYDSKKGRNLDNPLFLPLCHYNAGNICRESSFEYANAVIGKINTIKKLNKEKKANKEDKLELVLLSIVFGH
jgi:hypothetical protein